ncbi:pentapeptide repeat-containing protein [Campylobacter jejuni]|uniref:pentapeptide repeat-containing protein n=1 Tax=Campylobacter TaxID=194 RepID=UPI0023517311|nr:pentapeptide repeat-containing protein [Campylobacter jejuni]MDC8075563.1 pentapeptide repeat-containing protein [Campylobacter jejuni]MDC8090969.1 pentapeptide repeat-containing protein [Campylobacter jejuni]HEB9999281.1 pentapeptide repeat-containing protein [Campylobacter jejuni]HEC1052826.1 pentapeptide repeat-containing protein [Campylobacter jejuni]
MDLVSSFLSKKNINNEEDIKFENYIKGEAKLNSEKQYIIESSCCFDGNKDNFKRHYDENKILEIHLNNMVFEQYLSFHNVKKLSLIIDDNVKFQRLHIFGCNELSLRINGRVKIIDKISINNCKFKQISINNHIDGNIEFQKCEFNDFNLYGFSNATIKGTFTFDFCEIKEKVNFMNFEFENKVSFKMSKFKDNVYFNNSHFKDYVDFHECEFEKTASFYGVRFEKVPNFSACYFKEPKAVNLTNVNIDKLDFKSLEQYIEDNYKDESYKNETKGIQDEKEIFKIQNEHQLRYAKNLKDSFRVIKDVLITQNNTLEAQEWHKLELYAKEKELLFEVESCYKEKNKPFIAAKSEDKNSINLTFSVLLLWIYRVTSLHHTNLPRIINFASLNIVAFGGLVCLITYLSYHINKQSNFWLFGVLILFALIIGIVSLLLKKQKLKNITLILCLFLAFLLALFLMQRIAFLSSFGDIIFALLFYCLLVIVLIYLYPYINLKSFISYCFNWLVYFFLVMIVVIKPQLINPFAGIFSSDKLYESQFEKSLNDLNVSAIMILTDISQDNFNLPSKDQNISFVELNSAKALIIANKEKLKEILSKVYNDKYVSDYKKVLNELENNTSNVKNIIEEIDNKNNNSVISVQLNQILNFNFSQEIDILYMIKSNFFISEKLSPEQMAIFDQKDSQDKLKSVLALLKFKSSFEGILKIINQDEITENTIKSTSVLYGIILLLCIFSLQKTARKNSIVPS